MADMVPHYCAACGEMHGGNAGKDPAIKIAEINAQRDIEVARLNREGFQRSSEELAAEVEVAEIEAGAQVESAEAIGDALAPADPVEPPTEVLTEDSEVTDDEGEEAEPEPPETASSPTPREPKKATHWGAYR